MLAQIKKEEASALKILLLQNKPAFNRLYKQILVEHGCSVNTHFIDINSRFINPYPPTNCA